MKTFTEYLTESIKQYDFRIKIAGDMTPDQESKLKTCLEKFALSSFKKTAKTPIQEMPLDFPQVKNCEVNVFEVVVDYPTTQPELHEYISSSCGFNKSNVVVKKPGEPTEEYQMPVEKREGSLLNDPNYKEAPDHQFEDFYGDKYNSGFIKELNDILKLQRKERGEVIPATENVKFNTDSPCGSVSPIQQATDPRKK